MISFVRKAPKYLSMTESCSVDVADTIGLLGRSDKFADVVIHCRGKVKIKTNKSVLAGCSNLLKTVFEAERRCGCSAGDVADLVCPDFDPEAVDQVLNLIYEGETLVESRDIYVSMKKVLKALEIFIDYQEIFMPQSPAFPLTSNARSKAGQDAVNDSKKLKCSVVKSVATMSSLPEHRISVVDVARHSEQNFAAQVGKVMPANDVPGDRVQMASAEFEELSVDLTAHTDSASLLEDNSSLTELRVGILESFVRQKDVLGNTQILGNENMSGTEEDKLKEYKALTNDILTQMEELASIEGDTNNPKYRNIEKKSKSGRISSYEMLKPSQPMGCGTVIEPEARFALSLTENVEPMSSIVGMDSIEATIIVTKSTNISFNLEGDGLEHAQTEAISDTTNQLLPTSTLPEVEIATITNDDTIQLAGSFSGLAKDSLALSTSMDATEQTTFPVSLSNGRELDHSENLNLGLISDLQAPNMEFAIQDSNMVAQDSIPEMNEETRVQTVSSCRALSDENVEKSNTHLSKKIKYANYQENYSIENSANDNNNSSDVYYTIYKEHTFKILSYQDLVSPTIVKDESKYFCKICTTTFRTKGNMLMHYTSHFRNEILAMNNNNLEICIACNDKFITSQSLLYHIGKSHNGFKRLFSEDNLAEISLEPPVERRGRKRASAK